MALSTNLKLKIEAHGSNTDNWDQIPINDNYAILDGLLGSVTTKSLSNVNVTLTATEAQANILRFSGALTGNVAVNVGAVRKTWTCENACTGAFVVTITGGSGNVVGIPPGSCQVYWDGTNAKHVNLGRVGEYWDYAGDTSPPWVTACTVPPALILNGNTISAVTYPLLVAILGTTTLPDGYGRARFALNIGTGRITTAGSGIDGNTRFSSGGAQNVTLTTPNLPPYTPTGTNAASNINISGQGAGLLGLFGSSGFNAGPSGAGAASFSTLSGNADAQTFTGSAQGGTSTPVNKMPPALIYGVPMIWAL